MSLPTITPLPTAPSRSDTPTNFNALADTFLAAWPGLVSEINAFGAAVPAMVNGIDYNGTSTTSVLIGTGSKAFTTQTGKNFQVGQSVRVAYTTTPANYMDGQVTAYDSGTGAITVNVTAVGGSGTFALWTISLAVSASGYASITGVETLTNKTLTTPVLSATGAGTTAGQIGYSGGALTFGDGAATRTLVTTNNTQTLTGKTIDTASNTLKVNGNTLSATAGTATIILPNVSDTLVGRGTTDTLTNKTLTSPAINGGTITGATIATLASALAVAQGGTGATSASAARTALGVAAAPSVSGTGGSDCAVALGGGLVWTSKDITVTAGSSGAQAYGNGHTYTTWARAWIAGDDATGDVSVTVAAATSGLSSAVVRSNAAGTVTVTLFSIGV